VRDRQKLHDRSVEPAADRILKGKREHNISTFVVDFEPGVIGFLTSHDPVSHQFQSRSFVEL
jgi:hypothetical protein